MKTQLRAKDLVTIYKILPPEMQQRIQDKCEWEGMSVVAVMDEWPSLWHRPGISPELPSLTER